MSRGSRLTPFGACLVAFAIASIVAACAQKAGPPRTSPTAPAPIPAPAVTPTPSGSAAPATTGKMTKVVFRTVLPGLSADNPDTKPKTLYRLDNRYGRIEYPLDPATGLQALVIVASPDAWFVDRGKSTATHILDPGPTYNFRAPIAPHRGLPPEFLGLEFGRELDFVDAHGAKVKPDRSPRGEAVDIHESTLNGVQVLVSTEAGTRKVLSVVLARDKTILVSVHYDEYATDLPPDLSLFAPPAGVRISEQQAQKKVPKKR